MEKRNSTRGRIINYMLNHPVTSKAELAKELNISMPTVLTNVNELIAQNLLTELGEYESTGGRKASASTSPTAGRWVSSSVRTTSRWC